MSFPYTPHQKEAIDHRGSSLLILACAGSGKTEVISNRIARLVAEKVPKREIIAFTFTERAAGELKLRIREHLEAQVPDDPSLGDMYVGTIHSFCLKLLREEVPKYRNFEVMDEARQAALIMSNFRKHPTADRGIGLDALRGRVRSGSYWDTIRTFITTLNVVYQKNISLTKIKDDELRSVIERYQKIAHGHPNFFFDFDMIISALIQHLRTNKDSLEKIREKFSHLVVDEYQDVDDRQEELIRLLSDSGKRMHVTAVGDDDQAIYGWRGARLENILRFQENYKNVKSVTLNYNFRSTVAIVEIANAAIKKLPATMRISKDMEARRWDAARSQWRETLSDKGDVQVREFQSEQEEAEWIANRIQQLVGTEISEKDGSSRGICYSDMAILLRSVRSTGALFRNELKKAGIPAVIKGTGGLFAHDEVSLVHASFSLLARESFWLRTDEGVTLLDELDTRDFIRKKILDLREKGLMPKAEQNTFLEWIGSKREELDRRNLEKDARGRLARRIYPQDIFHQMLRALGSSNTSSAWPEDVLYNLGRLSGLITQFEAVHQWITPKDLASLCLFLGGWAAGQTDEGAPDELIVPNAVQIMTVHAAKGLEWPVVFVPRVSGRNFPSSFRDRGPETFVSKTLFDSSEYAGGIESERRLWYVAITRCRKFLHVSSPNRKGKKPTSFMMDIHHDGAQRTGAIPDKKKVAPVQKANAGLLPTTYSDLSTYWRCPFEYQLRELMGFGPGVKESYGYGQQIHNVLAEAHELARQGKTPSIDEVMSLVEERFHLRYTRDGAVHKPFSRLKEAAMDSLKLYLQRYPDNLKYVLEAEKPFEFVDRESGALISGTVDLLKHSTKGKNGQEFLPVGIVDFKTHRPKDDDREKKFRESLDDQLRLYALAVRKALRLEANEAQAHVLSPRKSEAWVVDVSPALQEEVRKKVNEAVTGIRKSVEKKKFELKGCEKGFCRTCDFREFCPGYEKWKKLDKKNPRPGNPEESRDQEMRLIEEELAGE